MKLIDTHAHLYLDHFDEDRGIVIERARGIGVEQILLPNIDKDSIAPLVRLFRSDPNLFVPMMGLHPTSVKQDYQEQLKIIFHQIEEIEVCAVGEIGVDLYWDKTFFQEQKEAFDFQLKQALKRDLPVAIHMRNSFEETYEIVKLNQNGNLKGVFHCFTGTLEQAQKLIDIGFYLGIGGVVTYKNSGLDDVIKQIDLKHILLETDSPFLPPVPHRGKRNESAFLLNIAQKIALEKGVSLRELANITSQNAVQLFNLNYE